MLGGGGGDGVVGVEDVDLAIDDGGVVGFQFAGGDGSGDFSGGGDFDAAGADDGAHDATGDDDLGALEDSVEAGGGFDEDGATGGDAVSDAVAADDDIFELEVAVAFGAAGIDGAEGDAERFAAEGAVHVAGGGGAAGFGARGDLVPVDDGEANVLTTEERHGLASFLTPAIGLHRTGRAGGVKNRVDAAALRECVKRVSGWDDFFGGGCR